LDILTLALLHQHHFGDGIYKPTLKAEIHWNSVFPAFESVALFWLMCLHTIFPTSTFLN